jgi:hypothetical protein
MVPGRILAAALAAAAVAVLATLWIALHEPWLGVSFGELPPEQPGLVVEQVDAAAAAAGLRSGDVARAIRAGGRTFELPASWLVETPSYFIQYRDYNEFLRRQAELGALLEAPEAELLRADGSAVRLAVRARPLDALPASFWYQTAYALLAFSVGAVLLAFRSVDPAARWFALTSLGFFLGTLMRALYGSRSLVIDAGALEASVALAHACALVSTAALASFVWHFPRPRGAAPLPAFALAFAGAAWVIDTWQLVPTTNVAYRGPLLLLTLLVAGLAVWQWRAARGDPVHRVLSGWLLLIMLAGPLIWGSGLAVVAMGWELAIPRGTHGLSSVLLIYLGMALLIMKHRAFDLERWWFEAWTWFLCGALVIGLDLLLVYTLSIQTFTALAISLAAAGWLYFPFRQWLMARLWRRRERDLRDLFPELVRILLAPADGAPPLEERWRDLLARVFQPRGLEQLASGPNSVRIEQGGLRLLVPQAGGAGALALDHAGRPPLLATRRAPGPGPARPAAPGRRLPGRLLARRGERAGPHRARPARRRRRQAADADPREQLRARLHPRPRRGGGNARGGGGPARAAARAGGRAGRLARGAGRAQRRGGLRPDLAPAGRGAAPAALAAPAPEPRPHPARSRFQRAAPRGGEGD